MTQTMIKNMTQEALPHPESGTPFQGRMNNKMRKKGGSVSDAVFTSQHAGNHKVNADPQWLSRDQIPVGAA